MSMEFRILRMQEEVHRLDWNNLFSLRPLPREGKNPIANCCHSGTRRTRRNSHWEFRCAHWIRLLISICACSVDGAFGTSEEGFFARRSRKSAATPYLRGASPPRFRGRAAADGGLRMTTKPQAGGKCRAGARPTSKKTAPLKPKGAAPNVLTRWVRVWRSRGGIGRAAS